MPIKQPCVYILAIKKNGTLYVGVTSNLPARVWQHKHEVIEGFSQRYGIRNLVWYEVHTVALWKLTSTAIPGVPEQSCDLAKWSRDQSLR